jgi:hypothetical protein
MPVIINDFEVVTEPAPSTEAGRNESSSESEQKTKPSLEEVLDRFQERIERIRAH